MVRRVTVGLMIALLLAGCASTKPDMAALSPTPDTSNAVAKITYPTGATDFVSRAEFEQARDKLLQPGTPEANVLDYVTSRHLLLREAKGTDITVDPKEVDTFVDNIRTQTCPQLPIPEAQGQTDPTKLMEACAKFFGFDGTTGMRRYIQEETTINALVKKQAKPSEEIHAAHILVKTEDEAKKARERVTTGGEDFNTVAKEISIEPAAKQSGGDLGFFGPGQMVAPFEQAALALKDGEISQPVQTQFGWHVIKVIERRQASGADASQGAATVYRQQILQQAKDAGQVEFLITPAPPPTQAAPPVELPPAEPGATAEPGAAPADPGVPPDTTSTP